ncbi:hypothetical protein [Delftia acidovorans]|uniref:hypothetical protein n=1 Tax=Delftia acidovorans TaxID=80866 RepID=UPI00359F7F74
MLFSEILKRSRSTLALVSFPFLCSFSQAGVFNDPNAQVVRWLHSAQDIPASEIESRVLNLHPYGAPDDWPMMLAPADGRAYLVYRNVQKNVRPSGVFNDRAGTSPYGPLKTPNATNLSQFTGLVPPSPAVSYQRHLSSAYTAPGSSGSQVAGSRFGVMMNLWDVDHTSITTPMGGHQTAVQISFNTPQKAWTDTNSIFTAQSTINVPWVNFGGTHPCDRPGVNPNLPLNMPSGTISYGFYFKDAKSKNFLNLGTDLFDTRRLGINCNDSALLIPSGGVPFEMTRYSPPGEMMESSILQVISRLSVNSKFLDVSGFVTPDCRNAQMGVYNHECMIRIHIPYAKFKSALMYPDAASGGQPICSARGYSCDPLDYELSHFEIGAEMHNVSAQPYATNTFSWAFNLGEIYLFEMK